METMITIQGIAYRKKPKAPMTEITRVEITGENGLVPDFRGKPGKPANAKSLAARARAARVIATMPSPWPRLPGSIPNIW